MKLTWAEYERGGIFCLPAILRNQATTTRAEHIQYIFDADVAISVLCVMKINLPHIPCFVRSFYELEMIPKKVTEFCLTEEVPCCPLSFFHEVSWMLICYSND